MKITLNGEAHETTCTTVAELVAEAGLGARPVAVMVNDQVVRRAEHGSRTLAEGDRVELISLIGGG